MSIEWFLTSFQILYNLFMMLSGQMLRPLILIALLSHGYQTFYGFLTESTVWKNFRSQSQKPVCWKFATLQI